jgi:hypothetical protein
MLAARDRSVIGALVLALASCSSPPATDTHTPPVSTAALTIAVVSGAYQVAPRGQPIPDPIVVLVTDSAGHPVTGVPIVWTAPTGVNAGHLNGPDTTVTGADGTAFVRVTVDNSVSDAGAFLATVVGGPGVYVLEWGYRPPLSIAVTSTDVHGVTCSGVSKGLYVYATDGAAVAITGALTWSVPGLPGDSLPSGLIMFQGTRVATIKLGSSVGAHQIVASMGGVNSAPFTITTASPCPPKAISVATSGGAGFPIGSSVTLNAHVTNDSGGPVLGATVRWRVGSGIGAGVTPAVSQTDANGIATTSYRLGTAAGTYGVVATVDTLQAGLGFTALPFAPSLIATFSAPAGATSVNNIRVRDGVAFVSAANQGVAIYDVGSGIKGGSPTSPVFISQVITNDDGVGFGPAANTSWWFKNPVRGESKYLFVGQAWGTVVGMPDPVGDVHVVDVSDLTHPMEVGFVHVSGGGAHDLWMDEAKQALYVAYEGAGMVKVDVSGVLAGDVSVRKVAQTTPSGAGGSAMWSAMLAGSTLFGSDLNHGLVLFDPASLGIAVQTESIGTPVGGSMSGAWIPDSVAYTGTFNACGQGLRAWSVKNLLSGNLDVPPTSIALVSSACTISSVTGSPDGRLLVVSAEQGDGAGLWIFTRADPYHPVVASWYPAPLGIRAAEVASISGRTYVFAIREAPSLDILVFDVTTQDGH